MIILFTLHVHYNCTQNIQKWSKTQHLYCTYNINNSIKQGKYMSQEQIISLILLHYIRKLKEAVKNVCNFFVNLIYFLETSDKIATEAFLTVETNTHFTGNESNISKFALHY